MDDEWPWPPQHGHTCTLPQHCTFRWPNLLHLGIAWQLAHRGVPRTGTPGKWTYQSLDLLRSVDAAETCVVFDFGDESSQKHVEMVALHTSLNGFIILWTFGGWCVGQGTRTGTLATNGTWVSFLPWCCIALLLLFCCSLFPGWFRVLFDGGLLTLDEHTFVWTLLPPLSLVIKVPGGGWSQGSSKTRDVICGEVQRPVS